MASVANAFALLSAGDDATDVDVQALAAAAPVPKPAAAAAPAAAEEKARPASAGGRGGRGEVTGRGAGRGAGGRGAGRGPRPVSRGGDDAPSFDAEAAPSVRGRGEGRERGGRGGRGGRGPRAGKREYDRQDGTGRGHETEKRHGGGAHNWGEEGKEEPEAEAKAEAEQNIESVEQAAAEETAAAVEAEEEEKQMTLEEYEAVLAEKRAGLNLTREAAFKADEKQFQGMKTFEKVEEDVGLGLTKNVKVIGANKAGREKELKDKNLLKDVGFRIQSETEFRGGRGEGRGRGRGGRGGRGEGRGRGEARGRGGRGFSGRGGRGAAPSGGAPLDLEAAFPALA